MTDQTPHSGAATKAPFKPRITVFHCVNALSTNSLSPAAECEVKSIKMPCSSMLREVFLLRAFEAGADAVVVLACPAGACHNINGNVRAARRVARMKKLVDDIGLDGRRLNIFNIAPEDRPAVERIIDQTVSDLAGLGPNPAAGQ